jgi:1-acyl-sn-glycerol-3-phosphate acyltransferase
VNIKTIQFPWLERKRMYNFYRVGARALIRMLYDIEVDGRENIPDKGAYILISNHVSYMDGLLLHAAITNRHVRYVIDQEIYELPGVNYFMKLDGAIPILPRRDSVAAALAEVSQALRNGEVIFIFPEGSLTFTGNLARFRFGVEWMLKNDQVPVIPMVIHGMWGSAFSRKHIGKWYRWIPKSFHPTIKVCIGQPIPPEKAQINSLQRVIMEMLNNAR